MDKRCDLHIHSTFSDSDAGIEDIFRMAKNKGLSCIAITDHDTIEAIEPARALSKTYNIELIEAMELSAQKDDVEVHVLSYFIDTQNKELARALPTIKQLRKERLLSMVVKLRPLGIDIDEQEIIAKVGDAIPTRLHLALYMVEKRIVGNLKEAFRKYLSPGKPAYAGRFKYSVKEAIGLIKKCGGLAFLAHPHFIFNQSWIEEFISYGLDGLEIIYPSVSEAKMALYKDTADKLGLLKSGGSDAHGSYKEFTQVGGVTIPYRWVEEMKQRAQQNLSSG